MLASVNWLKKYVNIEITPMELADKLTGAGLEVEEVKNIGEGLEGVLTGRVTEIERHPDSTHLWICQMDYGSGEIVQILTGAQNVKKNDIVPVAVVGSRLPNGMKLKKAKMRGLDSFGMLCSAGELGIDAKTLMPEERDGIFILPENTPVGVDIKEILGLNDSILDIDLTANKQDCFCMTGIAREASAVTEEKFSLPDMSVKEAAEGDINEELKTSIEIPELCSRFTARLLKNVKVMESPQWMKNALRACKVRPINNIVDVTNYVMLELGQPMHAYDYDKLAGHELIVRKANAGEKLVTLDEIERELTENMIVISDAEKAVGLGGVMGGLETEVTAETVNVALEAAAFNGASIRRTSKALGLRSEASLRFERGVDIAHCEYALNRAANLLEAMGACETVPGIVESYPAPLEPTVITVSAKAINTRIGTEIPVSDMILMLRKVYFEVEEKDGILTITVPSWRSDVSCYADISEEVARMYDYDNIKTHKPLLELHQGKEAPAEEVKDKVQDYMVAAGLDEVMTYSFVHPSFADKMLLAADDPRREVIKIKNPISDEFGVMRTTMIPSMLQAVSHNTSRQASTVKVFEVARVYLPKKLPLTDFPEEKRVIAAAISGKRNHLSWTSGKEEVDFYDMKGVVEGLFAEMGLSEYELEIASEPYLHPGKSCLVKAGEEVIGYFGALHPLTAEAFEVPEATYVLELALDPLVASSSKVPQYTHLAKFPGMSRDIAVVVPETVSAKELEGVIRRYAGELLRQVTVFDVYTGKQVDKGFKSVAFNLTFRADDRTLTDKEIDAVIKDVVAKVGEFYDAQLRK